MTERTKTAALAALLFSAASFADAGDIAREAVTRSLTYLGEEGEWWINEKGCVSCHHTGFLIWSHQLAASRGIPVSFKKLEGWSRWAVGHQLSLRKDEKGNYLAGVVGSANMEGLTQLILGTPKKVADEKKKEFADFRELIRASQQEDGSWKPGGQLPTQKRPALETRAVSAMWAAIALDEYGGDDTRDRALAWLQANRDLSPKSTEYAAMRLVVAGRFAGENVSAETLRALLERQNPDGGWSWLDSEPSGPMATGQALFALGEAGVDLDGFSGAIDRARRFLSRNQRKNGSWETRSTKAANKGKSTRVSDFYGSSWAVIGLCRTMPAPDS